MPKKKANSSDSTKESYKATPRSGRKKGAVNFDKAYLFGLVTKHKPTNGKNGIK